MMMVLSSFSMSHKQIKKIKDLSPSKDGVFYLLVMIGNIV